MGPGPLRQAGLDAGPGAGVAGHAQVLGPDRHRATEAQGPGGAGSRIARRSNVRQPGGALGTGNGPPSSTNPVNSGWYRTPRPRSRSSPPLAVLRHATLDSQADCPHWHWIALPFGRGRHARSITQLPECPFAVDAGDRRPQDGDPSREIVRLKVARQPDGCHRRGFYAHNARALCSLCQGASKGSDVGTYVKHDRWAALTQSIEPKRYASSASTSRSGHRAIGAAGA